MSRRIVLPLGGAALVGAVVAVAWAAAGGGAAAEGTDNSLGSASTATVERRDLVEHETLSGTLGYADPRSVYAAGQGVVTALRQAGATVTRGHALYWVDGDPVTLLYGSTPLWRRLDPRSTDGPDIRQLERNLVALGYGSNLDVDDDWTAATTAAVKDWQEDLGVPETGVIEPGRVVFLPGQRRIGELKTQVGAALQPGAEVMETTSTSRSVSVDLDADLQSLVRVGEKVEVELPDGGSVDGRVTKIGKVAETEVDPQTGQASDPTIALTIALAPNARVGSFDEAPVDVLVTQDQANGVLAVPVSALLALAEGGYAVEAVSTGGRTQLVKVETGMFADGYVEVRGGGLRQGMMVVVPE
jgi:peptidoglycan hydrolase-like protein with peptidoglycan-binding domain